MEENGRMFVSAVMHSIRSSAFTELEALSSAESIFPAIRWLDPLLRKRRLFPE
jgi:hypothetical protein